MTQEIKDMLHEIEITDYPHFEKIRERLYEHDERESLNGLALSVMLAWNVMHTKLITEDEARDEIIQYATDRRWTSWQDYTSDDILSIVEFIEKRHPEWNVRRPTT